MAGDQIETVSLGLEKKDKKAEDDDFERSAWGGQLEFILTCIGFAVGLGNVWRFPYLVYENGGGAFLIPYFLMLAFVGLPLFYMECAFGQFASLGPITAYSVSPVMKGVGVAGIVVAAYVVLYYNVIVAWCLYYFFASMNTELPWVTCGNWWNSEYCLEPGQSGNDTFGNVTYYTSSEEYFYNQVLRISDGLDNIGAVRWQLALCLGLAWCTIFLVLIKGIASLGKVSYFVTLFPYLLLTIMLIRGVTLPGSEQGIKFYLQADFSRLLEAKVWADAATQIFYSLGISMGGLIAMASFNNFNNNIRRDAILIPLVNCGTSFYAGFVIFSVLGYMAETKGVDISEVVAEGPGLVFVVYPEGLATMPGAPIWAVLFFFMMTTLGFSSQFSTSEGVISAFIDEFPEVLSIGMRPTLMRITLCVSFFLLGLPQVCEGGFYLFHIMNEYCAGYTLLIVAFFEVLTFQYIYGYKSFAEDIALMLGTKPGLFFQITWRFVTPAIILVVFFSMCAQQTRLTLGDYVYTDAGMALVWCIVAFPCIIILAVFLYTFCTRGGYKVLEQTSKPSEAWGPARKRDRRGMYALPRSTQDTVNSKPEPPPYWLSTTNQFPSFPNLSKPPSYQGNGSAIGMSHLKKRRNTSSIEEPKEMDTSFSSHVSVEVEVNKPGSSSKKSSASSSGAGPSDSTHAVVHKVKKTATPKGKGNPVFDGSDDDSDASSVGSSQGQYNMDPEKGSRKSANEIPTSNEGASAF